MNWSSSTFRLLLFATQLAISLVEQQRTALPSGNGKMVGMNPKRNSCGPLKLFSECLWRGWSTRRQQCSPKWKLAVQKLTKVLLALEQQVEWISLGLAMVFFFRKSWWWSIWRPVGRWRSACDRLSGPFTIDGSCLELVSTRRQWRKVLHPSVRKPSGMQIGYF